MKVEPHGDGMEVLVTHHDLDYNITGMATLLRLPSRVKRVVAVKFQGKRRTLNLDVGSMAGLWFLTELVEPIDAAMFEDWTDVTWKGTCLYLEPRHLQSKWTLVLRVSEEDNVNGPGTTL